MRMTVNEGNIRQFVDDMISRALPRPGRVQQSKQSITATDLNICATII